MLEILRSLLMSFFAIIVLLPVIRYALRRMLMGHLEHVLTADEMKYMQKQEWKLTWTYFFFSCVLAVFGAGSLALISSIIHAESKDFLFLLTPNFRALFAPGLLLGLTLAILPLKVVQRSIMGHDYDMYKEYLQQSEGRRSTGVYRILFLIMLAISAAVIWFAMQWHVTITQNQLKITNLLSENRTYALTDIEKIEYLGSEGEYLITFNDSNNLNTTYLKPAQFEMIAYLAEKSGKRVIR